MFKGVFAPDLALAGGVPGGAAHPVQQQLADGRGGHATEARAQVAADRLEQKRREEASHIQKTAVKHTKGNDDNEITGFVALYLTLFECYQTDRGKKL